MWLVTIVVIRILSPEDYGLMAMSMVFISLAGIINELGLGSALVQRADPTRAEIQAIHGFVLILNVFIYLLFYATAPYIAQVFGEPTLVSMLRIIALLFPILGFEVTALALLERRFEFRRKATVYMIANISGGLVTLTMALLSAGVWSLVCGNLWSALVKSIAINISSGRAIFPTWNLNLVRPYLHFGGWVATERVLWYVHRQADVFWIGILLGKEKLGYYYVALTLASFVYEKTGGLMYEISLPTFAEAQKEVDRVGRVFNRALRIVSFVVFPLMFGLAAVSDDLVNVILGDKWLAAAPLVLILSLSMPARILGNLFPPALQGIGHPKSSLLNIAFAVVVMVPALTVSALYDTNTVALAWLVVYPIVLLFMYAHSRALLGLNWTSAASAVLPSLVGSVVMFSLVYWLGYQLSAKGLAIELRLGASILSGVFVYVLFASLGMRGHLSELVTLFRR